MILVDASVIIDYDRKKDPKLGQLLLSQFSAICGVTRAEVLHGARSPAERSRLIGLLNSSFRYRFPIACGMTGVTISPPSALTVSRFHLRTLSS